MTAVTPPSLPLAGITVVALEQAVAAPIATRHLADLGARVIKIERPGEGDFARHYDHAVHGLASHFVWLNRGKESVALDLKSPDGLRLSCGAWSPGPTSSCRTSRPARSSGWASDGEALRAADPRLVVVNISGYGSAGPRRDRKAYDMLVQAESGLVAVTGTPETATKTGIPTADIAAGLYARAVRAGRAVPAGAHRRGRDDRRVDVRRHGRVDGPPDVHADVRGRQVPRMGLSHAAIAPYDAYPTATGRS